MSEVLVEVIRGPLVDTIHRGDLAVVDADGALVAAVGSPHKVAYMRSSAKPFQAMCAVYSGAAEHWSFSSEDIALIAGSHNGEPAHTERARRLLERIGLQPRDLACGVHPPLDVETARDLQERGRMPSVFENNCSGKHIGMLALALQLGAKTEGYESVEHPVQREVLQNVARFAKLDPDDIPIAVDGCGVPCFGLSLYRMAWAFARLLKPQGMEPDREQAAAVVASSMTAHPYLVAGRNRLDTALMEVGRGKLLAKGGAGGVQCVATTSGLGLAVKVEDGAEGPVSPRPAGLSIIEALRQMKVLDEPQIELLGDHGRRTFKSLSGRETGHARVVFQIAYA